MCILHIAHYTCACERSVEAAFCPAWNPRIEFCEREDEALNRLRKSNSDESMASITSTMTALSTDSAGSSDSDATIIAVPRPAPLAVKKDASNKEGNQGASEKEGTQDVSDKEGSQGASDKEGTQDAFDKEVDHEALDKKAQEPHSAKTIEQPSDMEAQQPSSNKEVKGEASSDNQTKQSEPRIFAGWKNILVRDEIRALINMDGGRWTRAALPLSDSPTNAFCTPPSLPDAASVSPTFNNVGFVLPELTCAAQGGGGMVRRQSISPMTPPGMGMTRCRSSSIKGSPKMAIQGGEGMARRQSFGKAGSPGYNPDDDDDVFGSATPKRAVTVSRLSGLNDVRNISDDDTGIKYNVDTANEQNFIRKWHFATHACRKCRSEHEKKERDLWREGKPYYKLFEDEDNE